MFSACSDDEQIGNFISGDWELDTYDRNGMDETNLVLISGYIETYEADGTYSRTYTSGKQEAVSESGEYIINEENRTLQISGISSISDFSDEHSTLSSSTYEVISISDTSFVYTFENGGDSHQFEMKRKN